jgi:putative ABC transport system ATP-binding protein
MLKIENIKKTFIKENSEKNAVLRGISLEVDDGDWLVIIGSNGSGKSTLLNCVSGAYTVDTGKIWIDEKDVTKTKEHKRAKFISRVFQDPNQGTIGDLSIFENLSLALNRGQPPLLRWALSSQKREFFEEKVADFGLGLDDRLDDRMRSLSGGQRQSLTLLMATFKDPKLILLDEHTAALDPKTSRKVLKMTEKVVTSTQIPTIMITHNLSDAIKYGNKLLMLKDGKVAFKAEGEKKKKLTLEELLKKYEEEVTD